MFFKRKTLNLGEVIDLAKTRMAFWVKGKYKVSGYSIEDFKRSSDGIRRLMIQKLKDWKTHYGCVCVLCGYVMCVNREIWVGFGF